MLQYDFTDKNLFWQNDFIALDESMQDDKIISWFESEEFKTYAGLMRGWYNKGIIPKYAATNVPQLQSDWNSGKAMFWAGTAARPFEGAATISQAVPDARLVNYFLGTGRPKSAAEPTAPPSLSPQLPRTRKGTFCSLICFKKSGAV